jgi:transglutaminase-like putative cysteine protease
MDYHVGCELDYETAQGTTLILNVEVQAVNRQQILRESFSITPFVPSEIHAVPETHNRLRRIVLPQGKYALRYDADVRLVPQVENPAGLEVVPIQALPLEVVHHLYPSRFCQSDKLMRFAWRRFADIQGGHERVTAICNWIFENVDYLAGSSDSSTSAYDTFTLRAGVCRDFAHLGITFCRALGIPARFISAYGYKLYPQDFHAVFEAYLGGRWYLFDPTRLSPPDGLIRIGVGRDAADTAFATYFGAMTGGPKAIWVESMAVHDEQAPWTTDAVSVSAR